MARRKSTTKKAKTEKKQKEKKYEHLTYKKRLRLEVMLRQKIHKQTIADELRVHISTIYREIKRGEYEHLNSDYTTEIRYSADKAEAKYQEGLAAKGAPLKIGNNFAVAEFIEEKILHEDYSPVAVCALLREEEYLEKYHITFCRATIYKYIDDGNIFPHITNKDLPEKGQRKREYKKVREKRAPRGRSIEERPPEVETREEVGHWEGDTVVGKKGSKARLLVFSERATRNEIIIKIPDGTTKSVVRALDRLERRFGADFPRIFKSITFDNGSEFADCEGLERSRRRKGKKRTTVYYCHPYTACERGTNENINRMIRRKFPKGTNFDKVRPSEVKAAETWLNNYPRGILGFRSAASVFSEAVGLAA